MESTRQLKVARQIQKDLGEIFQREAGTLFPGVMVTVTGVRVSPDLSFAKTLVSVFPFDKSAAALASLDKHNKAIRGALGKRMGSQLKGIPELAFQLDDSLEYIDNIDNLLK